jgi:hypothetical protein
MSLRGRVFRGCEFNTVRYQINIEGRDDGATGCGSKCARTISLFTFWSEQRRSSVCVDGDRLIQRMAYHQPYWCAVTRAPPWLPRRPGLG